MLPQHHRHLHAPDFHHGSANQRRNQRNSGQPVALELADIFRQYGTAYRQKYSAHLLPSHRRALRDIERCRTEALGGQVFTCSACGEVQYSC